MSWGLYEWELLNKKLDALKEALMAQADAINASLDDLNTKTDEAAARLKDILAAIQPGMTQEEADAIKARIDAEATRLGSWGVDPSDPLP